jgi:nucleolar protein 53
MTQSINDAKVFRRQVGRSLAETEKASQERKVALQRKLKAAGLTGQKLGKHKVPDADISVQLGEDLSESLRALKVWISFFPSHSQLTILSA